MSLHKFNIVSFSPQTLELTATSSVKQMIIFKDRAVTFFFFASHNFKTLDSLSDKRYPGIKSNWGNNRFCLPSHAYSKALAHQIKWQQNYWNYLTCFSFPLFLLARHIVKGEFINVHIKRLQHTVMCTTSSWIMDSRILLWNSHKLLPGRVAAALSNSPLLSIASNS